MKMKQTTILILIIGAAICATACGEAETTNANVGNQSAANVNAKSAVESNKPEPPQNATTPFEKALFSVRVGYFEQVLSFERKDGAKLTRADKDFLRANSPNAADRNVNRWTVSDDDKAALAGTNFKFTPENIAALKTKFTIKDYSMSNEGAEIK